MSDASILVSVGFDTERYIAPSRKSTRSIELGASEWAGWTVSVGDSVVEVFSPPVSRVSDVVVSLAARQSLRAATARMVTVIPRDLCVLTYAEVSGEEVQVAPAPAVATQAEVLAQLAQPPQPAAPVPAPTRRRLPPGAKPDVTPPPSRIGILDVGQPIEQSTPRDPLLVKER